MKKILSIVVCTLLVSILAAQEQPAVPKKKDKPDLSNRANDHFLIQLGYTTWTGTPDTINTSGLSKSFNAYFMLDFPFKTNPNLSIAMGPGIASDHILFTKTNLGIKDITPTIQFNNVPDTNHFKKTKLATVYLEAPIEFRYSAKPETGKGMKAALGVKIGTLINAHTRNSKLQNRNEEAINEFVMKESSKRYFNKTRISAMARVGMGHLSLYASYQLTTVFKDGAGPAVKPFSIGLTLSGL
jgi:Outer membrane protein beta-barrel domain